MSTRVFDILQAVSANGVNSEAAGSELSTNHQCANGSEDRASSAVNRRVDGKQQEFCTRTGEFKPRKPAPQKTAPDVPATRPRIRRDEGETKRMRRETPALRLQTLQKLFDREPARRQRLPVHLNAANTKPKTGRNASVPNRFGLRN